MQNFCGDKKKRVTFVTRFFNTAHESGYSILACLNFILSSWIPFS